MPDWTLSLLKFFKENWGNLASLLGAGLTIVFSIQAAQAANSAKKASEATRENLQSIDVLTELHGLSGKIDDLLVRLEAGTWIIVSERSTELRLSISSIISTNPELFSEEVLEKMTVSVTQFRNISLGADRANFTDQKPPDIPRYRKITTDQKEVLILALGEVKMKMGDKL